MPVLLEPKQAIPLASLLNKIQLPGIKITLPWPEQAQALSVLGLGSLSVAGSSEISFLSNPRLRSQLDSTQAGAVILDGSTWKEFQAQSGRPDFVPVLCDAPYVLYALLAQWFDQHRLANLPQGIHPSASIHSTAILEDGVNIGPFTVIEAGARIGSGTRIGPHGIVGANVTIGNNSLLHARVTLYHQVSIGNRTIIHSGAVIGADGFGFAPNPDPQQKSWVKIAQLGGVCIGDDAEIGANTTIDRGALDNTVVGHGVKLDNQIMVAHNVIIGDHTAIAACVGIAGSTRIGRYCTIGGAAMLSGHINLADNVHISGGTAITSNINQPGRYTGVYPYAEHREWQKNAAVVGQLARLRKKIRSVQPD